MKCFICKNSPAEYSFRAIEVHTLHVRGFDGENLIQALGEEKEFNVCAACVSSEMRAVLFPAKKILRECSGFCVLVLAGAAMSAFLSLDSEMMIALRILGPLAVFVGVSGIIAKVRDILKQRKFLSGLSHEEAMKFSAWQCVLKNAPKKYNDNDITYIPVDEVKALSPEELALRYNLLPPISRKACELIHKE